MRVRALGLSLIIIALLTANPTSAVARKVEDKYAKKVVLLKGPPPMKGFKSKSAFLAFLRAKNTKQLWPVKKDGRTWEVPYFAFFKRPTQDRELKIRFYDITEGKEYVAGDSLYTALGQRVIASRLTLDGDQGFKINRRYQVYLLGRGNVVWAQAAFWLRGQAEVYSGKVTFSDKDAKLN